MNIPVVFDTSFECYKILHPDEEFKEPGDYIRDILKLGFVEILNQSFMYQNKVPEDVVIIQIILK